MPENQDLNLSGSPVSESNETIETVSVSYVSELSDDLYQIIKEGEKEKKSNHEHIMNELMKNKSKSNRYQNRTLLNDYINY